MPPETPPSQVEPRRMFPAPPPVSEDETLTVSGDTWELTVPSTVERKQARAEALVFAGFDSTEKRLFLLIRKEVNGDSATGLTTFVTEVKSDFGNSGFSPVSETKGTINGVSFVKIEGFKAPLVLHNWMLVKSGRGYLFACGGIMTQAAAHAAVCGRVADSLKLK